MAGLALTILGVLAAVAGAKLAIAAVAGIILAAVIFWYPNVGLVCLILTGTCFQVFGSRGSTGLPINLSQIFVALTTLSYLIYMIRNKISLSYSPQLIALGLYAVVVFMSSALVADRYWAIFGVARSIEFFLNYYLIANIAGIDRKQLLRYCLLITIAVAISATIGILEYSLPQLAVENDDSTERGSIGAVLERGTLESSDSIKRISGGMLHANWLAYAAVAILPLNLFWWKHTKNPFARAAIPLCVVLLFLVIILSSTRSALIGFVVMVAYLILRRRLPAFRTIGLAVLALALVLVMLPVQFRERLFSLQFLKEGSTPMRRTMLISGLDMIRDRPLLGYGWRQYGFEFINRYYTDPQLDFGEAGEVVDYAIKTGLEETKDLMPHSLLLEVGIEFGLLGLAPFLAFLFLALADFRLCERYGDPMLQDLAVCLTAGMLAFYVCGIVSHLLELKLLWLLAGLSVAMRRVTFEKRDIV